MTHQLDSTPTGKYLYEAPPPHRCVTPRGPQPWSVWLCDCGQHFLANTYSGWVPITELEALSCLRKVQSGENSGGTS